MVLSLYPPPREPANALLADALISMTVGGREKRESETTETDLNKEVNSTI